MVPSEKRTMPTASKMYAGNSEETSRSDRCSKFVYAVTIQTPRNINPADKPWQRHINAPKFMVQNMEIVNYNSDAVVVEGYCEALVKTRRFLPADKCNQRCANTYSYY